MIRNDQDDLSESIKIFMFKNLLSSILHMLKILLNHNTREA